MIHLVNSLIRPLGWLIVPCNYTRKLFAAWLVVWIFIPTAFIIAQTATSEANKQAIDNQNLRLVRLEEKAEHITQVMTSIKYLEEKIEDVSSTQKYVLLGVLGALALNVFHVFTKMNLDLLHLMHKKHDRPMGK